MDFQKGDVVQLDWFDLQTLEALHLVAIVMPDESGDIVRDGFRLRVHVRSERVGAVWASEEHLTNLTR
jgi:hypothetical protein